MQLAYVYNVCFHATQTHGFEEKKDEFDLDANQTEEEKTFESDAYDGNCITYACCDAELSRLEKIVVSLTSLLGRLCDMHLSKHLYQSAVVHNLDVVA